MMKLVDELTMMSMLVMSCIYAMACEQPNDPILEPRMAIVTCNNEAVKDIRQSSGNEVSGT